MASGSAVKVAVGVGGGVGAVGPRLAGLTALGFLLHPPMAAIATARQRAVRMDWDFMDRGVVISFSCFAKALPAYLLFAKWMGFA
jgi:hypothetical protein